MVFVANLLSFLGYPAYRQTLLFGRRALTQRMIVEELVRGIFIVIPFCILVSFLLKRMIIRWKPPIPSNIPILRTLFRPNIWCGMIYIITGDLIVELWLTSLTCLPDAVVVVDDTTHENTDEDNFGDTTDNHNNNNDNSNDDSNNRNNNFTTINWIRFMQQFGFYCPTPLDRTLLLELDDMLQLLILRLIFVWIGIYVGQSLVPIALTGGIATGKSTVANLLLDLSRVEQLAQLQQEQQEGSGSATTTSTNNNTSNIHGSTHHHHHHRKAGIFTILWVSCKRLFWRFVSLLTLDLDSDVEGTFRIIDTDRIGHEILLPPDVLANPTAVFVSSTTGTKKEAAAAAAAASVSASTAAVRGSNSAVTSYSVSPSDSVYDDILQAFGDSSVNYRNILADDQTIDRRKLGAIIFQDPSQRRVLNKITHPKIISILLKEIVYGTLLGKENVVCADVPLLFESGMMRWFFGLIIVVACDADAQYQRLRKRNTDLTEQQCRERIASQMPIDQKIALADICIRNDHSLEDLAAQVEQVRADVVGRIYGMDMSIAGYVGLLGIGLLAAVHLKWY